MGKSVEKSDGTGTFYLNIYVWDKYYNYGIKAKEFKFDNTAPAFWMFSPNGSESYTTSKSVVMSFSDSGSGVKRIYYCWTGNSGGCTPKSTKYVEDLSN